MSFDVSDSCAGADMADVKQSPAPRLAASNAASGEGEERIVPPLILENGKFGCPECDKSYHRQCDYRSHYRVHDSKRPFECSICAQSFLRRHDLNRHTRIHSGAKPFKCFRCGKGFVRKDALRRHLNMDPNVQRFRCSLRAAPSVDMADYAGINGDDDDAGESASLSNGSEDSD
ncbi:hypothetical protein HK105_208468 [Polyrhizophydium stewartii]|uniref:C2H2-type domain-containing protein n=1 Tax=Polyrhizophydium stewartii TaxID=2732419 RepID=A0ABR4MXP6_9FUNG